MRVKDYLLRMLFQEPSQGRGNWVFLVGGLIVLLLFSLFSLSGPPYPLGLLFPGLMFIFLGASELLPRNRTTLAALLRVTGLIFLLLYIFYVVVPD